MQNEVCMSFWTKEKDKEIDLYSTQKVGGMTWYPIITIVLDPEDSGLRGFKVQTPLQKKKMVK